MLREVESDPESVSETGSSPKVKLSVLPIGRLSRNINVQWNRLIILRNLSNFVCGGNKVA